MIVPVLTTSLGLTFAGIAVGSFAAPKPFSEIYGMPIQSDRDVALYRAIGGRDLVLGAIIVAAERSGGTNGQVAGTVALSALAGLVDFCVVASTPDAKKSRLLIHGSGTLGIFVAAAIIALTPDDAPQEPGAAER